MKRAAFRVTVTGGQHRGRLGELQDFTKSGMVKVRLDGERKVRTLHPWNLQALKDK